MPKPRVERLQVMLSEDELKALDDWRFAHRMPSRAAAIRELLRRGLSTEGFALSPIPPSTRSKDYGVTGFFSKRGKLQKPANGSNGHGQDETDGKG